MRSVSFKVLALSVECLSDDRDDFISFKEYPVRNPRKAIEKIIKDYRLNPEMIIFEAGCAKGFIVQEFLQRGFLKSFGQDISKYAISSANEKCREHLKIGSISTIQCSDESVDFLYSKEVLPHMSKGDIKLFLSECNRVLKKNGQIILEIQ